MDMRGCPSSQKFLICREKEMLMLHAQLAYHKTGIVIWNTMRLQ
jgi:hypothetical protein